MTGLTGIVDQSRSHMSFLVCRPEAMPMSSTRRAVPVTCTTHSSGTNFCNLLMTRETDGTIVLDPHVAHCCVLRLDERAATAVFDTLGAWLGWPGAEVVHTP
jgi:hypothetical protein